MSTLTKDKYYIYPFNLELNSVRQQLFLEFATNPKTLAERMIEDSKEYEEWLNAQEHETNSLYKRK